MRQRAGTLSDKRSINLNSHAMVGKNKGFSSGYRDAPSSYYLLVFAPHIAYTSFVLFNLSVNANHSESALAACLLGHRAG